MIIIIIMPDKRGFQGDNEALKNEETWEFSATAAFSIRCLYNEPVMGDGRRGNYTTTLEKSSKSLGWTEHCNRPEDSAVRCSLPVRKWA